MSQLPLIHTQQKSTTRYCPSGDENSVAVFRPKLPFLSEVNSCALVVASSRSQGRSVSRSTSEGGQLTSASRLSWLLERRATARPATGRSLQWVELMERQGRQLIKAIAYSTSPVRCYFMAGDDEGCFLPSLCEPWPPTLTTEDELNQMIKRASVKAKEHIFADRWFGEGKQCAKEPLANTDAFKSVEESQMDIMREFVDLRSSVCSEFLKQVEIRRSLIDLVKKEKEARVAMLGEFISCCPPHPCRCLLLDMEVLEESAIPLEPAVGITCLYTSIVIGGHETLEETLLQQREVELQVLYDQHRFFIDAQKVLTDVRNREHERFESMMAYFAFALRLLREREALSVETTTPPGCDEGPRETKTRGKRFHMNYYKYLHVLGTIEVEEGARGRICAGEFTEIRHILYHFERKCRSSIVSTEELERQRLLLNTEMQQRLSIQNAEELALNETVCPRSFQELIETLMKKEREEWQRALEEARITQSIELVCEYEVYRRREIGLFEQQLRACARFLFLNTTDGAGRITVERWMREHEVLVVQREEAALRKRIVESEDQALTTWITAHRWMVDHDRHLQSIAKEKEDRRAVDRVIAEECAARGVVESLWAGEHYVLFGEVIRVPEGIYKFPEGRQSGEGRESSCGDGESASRGLDIRQVVIANLGEFFNDRALLGFFDRRPVSPI